MTNTFNELNKKEHLKLYSLRRIKVSYEKINKTTNETLLNPSCEQAIDSTITWYFTRDLDAFVHDWQESIWRDANLSSHTCLITKRFYQVLSL